MPQRKPLIVLGVMHSADHPSYEATLRWIEQHVKPGMQIGMESADQKYITDPGIRHLPARVIDVHGGKAGAVRAYRKSDLNLPLYPREIEKFFEDAANLARSHGATVHSVESRPTLRLVLELQDKHEALTQQLKEQERRYRIASDPNSLQGFVQTESGLYLPASLVGGKPNDERERLEAEIDATKNAIAENEIQTRIYHALRSKFHLRNALKPGDDILLVGGAHARHIDDFAPHVPHQTIYPGITDAEKAAITEFAPGQPEREQEIRTRMTRLFKHVSATKKRRPTRLARVVARLWPRRER